MYLPRTLSEFHRKNLDHAHCTALKKKSKQITITRLLFLIESKHAINFTGGLPEHKLGL